VSYRQAVTPDRLEARTNATMRSFNRAAVVVGAAVGGLVADAIGFRSALWLAAAGMVVAALGAGRFTVSSTPDAATERPTLPRGSPPKPNFPRWAGRGHPT
jgi:predicted MFS family arabinose efflux permease